jgi:hypothetical protein
MGQYELARWAAEVAERHSTGKAVIRCTRT